jgi:hypothetical protein
MADEIRRISIPVPNDLLKEAEGLPKAASTSDSTIVSFQFTPQAVASILELQKDYVTFQKTQIENSREAIDKFRKICEMSVAFYEKLILLAGGSFALSLTFLGSLHRASGKDGSLRDMAELELAWGFLLVAILLCWLHNFVKNTAVDRAVAASVSYITSVNHTWASNLMTRTVGILKPAEAPGTTVSDIFVALGNLREAASKKALDSGAGFIKETTWHMKLAALAGGMRLLAIIIAFCLMILFAVNNATLL